MAGMLRVHRSRGALTGLLLVLLGAWGGIIPFVGPYFRYAYTPDTPWQYTTGRLWLDILPGAAAFLGGLLVLGASVRPVALFGGLLSAAAGAWFALGTVLSPLWASGGTGTAGRPIGGTVLQAVEHIGFFTGLGVAIVFLAGVAIGRLTVVSLRDSQYAAAVAAEPETVPPPRQPA